MQIQLQSDADTSAREAAFIEHQLNEFNARIVGADQHVLLRIFVRDDEGNLAAGLLGGTYWGWLHVDYLWVREDVRQLGWGSRLLAEAEAEALRRGCHHAHVDTMDFQAPDFYRRHGYTEWGVLNEIPKGHRRFSFQKKLT